MGVLLVVCRSGVESDAAAEVLELAAADVRCHYNDSVLEVNSPA